MTRNFRFALFPATTYSSSMESAIASTTRVSISSVMFQAFKQLAPVYLRHPLLLGSIFLTSLGLQQYFLYLRQILQVQLAPGSHFLLLNEAASFTVDTACQGLLLLSIPAILHSFESSSKLALGSHMRKNIAPVCIELLRVTARVMRWGLLFIVPGFYKHMQYMFVPYIVMADPRYQMGHVDALQRSEQLLKGRFAALFIFLCAFLLLSTVVFLPLAEASITETPITLLLLSPLRFSLDLFFYIFMYYYFNAASQQKDSTFV